MFILKKNCLFLFIYFLGIYSLNAQNNALQQDTLFLRRLDSLILFSDNFLNIKVPEKTKNKLNKKFTDLFGYLLEDPRTFNADFSELKSVSSLKNTEAKVAIYTWFTLSKNGYKPHGIVQKLSESQPTTATVTVLKNNNWPKHGVQYSTLTDETWFGALYYAIQRIEYKDESHFVLLGFHAGNGLVKKKVIDILRFNGNNQPVFGAPLFFDEKGRMHNRIIFKYSAKVSMSLKFNDKKDAIVYDHLSPGNPSMEGNYMYYGPDFSYDRYRLKKGKWILDTDYEAENDTENLGKKGKILKFTPKPDSLPPVNN